MFRRARLARRAVPSSSSPSSSSSSSSSSSTTLTRKEREKEVERQRELEKERALEAEKAKKNPRFAVSGLLRLSDYLLDHEVVGIIARFTTNQMDLNLSEELLSTIASDYLYDVFSATPYRDVIHDIKIRLATLRDSFEKIISLLDTPESSTEEVVSDHVQIMTATALELSEYIDQAIVVIRAQYVAHQKRGGGSYAQVCSLRGLGDTMAGYYVPHRPMEFPSPSVQRLYPGKHKFFQIRRADAPCIA